MAHELDIQNGKASIAYVGEKPWHGLGQSLTEDAPIEVWRVEAGMDWQILNAAANYVDNDGTHRAVDNRRVFYRSDNKAALSIVSDKFKVVQPSQILEFYRDLVEQYGFKLETAGCLFGGTKFWALARCGESARIMGQDEIKPYLLLASACDGSMSTVAHFTSVRVVCNNTLRMSVGANGSKAQLRVPHQADFNADKVKIDLGVVTDIWSGFIGDIERLAHTSIAYNQAVDIIAHELKVDNKNKETGEALTTQDMMGSSSPLRRIISLYDGQGMGSKLRSSKGTAWGLVNAVTEFSDHETGSKNGDKSRSFERAHLTDRASFKVAVTNELLKLAA